MVTLVLPNMDKRLVDALADRAKANDRTLEEAGVVLSQALGRPGASDKWEEARRIAAMTPTNVPQTDSVLLLREDRER